MSYLIYNTEKPEEFMMVRDYQTVNIPAEWAARIVSGLPETRGLEIATKPKNGTLTVNV